MPERILIVGCAKSGTTLLRRMFYAYGDSVEVIPREISVDRFAERSSDRILVGKRNCRAVFSSVMDDAEFDRQMALLEGVTLVYIGRPAEKVVRKGVTLKRWQACHDRMLRCHGHLSLMVTYDRLVTEPDVVQDMVERRVPGLTRWCRWSEYPAFVPPGVVEAEGIAGMDGYELRGLGRHVGNGGEGRPLSVPDDFSTVSDRMGLLYRQLRKEIDSFSMECDNLGTWEIIAVLEGLKFNLLHDSCEET